MNTLFLWLAIVSIALVLTLIVAMARRRNLRRFWNRGCAGIRWRRRFPDDAKADIRAFLTVFVDAFGYDHKRRTCFSPDDRVMQIYHAMYPPGSLGDDMELEQLGMAMEERYGMDFTAVWRDDITLGELYEQTGKHAT